jgi:4-amino-4-deoxy-L-arabinose transferase-like glycosyltransferase
MLKPCVGQWPYLLLATLTLLCLLPFLGRAFQIDDPLFIWAAEHIVQQPTDPFRFQVTWALTAAPMWTVTQNPPLASYYIALVGGVVGWSEKTLHLAFLLPALGVIMGTYRLAQRFTRLPLIAALATLLTPGFLVSSTTVMCDVMMLAFWITAMIFWLEGLDPIRPHFLLISGILMGACCLTKYFGLGLIPLLFSYSIARRRRIENWIWYLLIPICMIAGYELWGHMRYGTELLSQAAEYAINYESGSPWSKPLIALAFVGGCAISTLGFAPLMWNWRWLLAGTALGAVVALATATGFLPVTALPVAHNHWNWISGQLALYMLGGVSVLAIAISDWRREKDADSLLLMLWVVGTFLFAGFVNWVVNARSILPLIPAAGILCARCLQPNVSKQLLAKISLALAISGGVSLWVTLGDAQLANSARTAAALIHQKASGRYRQVFFQGHWGFQYYMQKFGFVPYDKQTYQPRPEDLMVIPGNNADFVGLPPSTVIHSRQKIELQMRYGTTTISGPLGAGFYFSAWEPLPFAFGKVPAECYYLLELAPSPTVHDKS